MVKHNMHKLSDGERNLLRHYAEGERRQRSPTNACSPAPSRDWLYRGATEARAKCAYWRDGCRSKGVERRGCDSRVTPVEGASNTAAALTAPALLGKARWPLPRAPGQGAASARTAGSGLRVVHRGVLTRWNVLPPSRTRACVISAPHSTPTVRFIRSSAKWNVPLDLHTTTRRKRDSTSSMRRGANLDLQARRRTVCRHAVATERQTLPNH